MSSNFLAAVHFTGDAFHHPQWFWIPRRKNLLLLSLSPCICHEIMGSDAMILVFLIFSFKLALSFSFTLIKRLFGSSSLSATGVVSSAYLRLLMLLLLILIPACNSSSPAFPMMCSAYRLKRVIADSPVILPSWSRTNQLFYTGF